MKKLTFAYLCLLLLISCAPGDKTPASVEYTFSMETQEAIEDWSKTLKETDECSSTNGLHWFAEKFLDKNWQDCCVQHDFDYREGSKYDITQQQADYELWQCIVDSGHPVVANTIYLANTQNLGYITITESKDTSRIRHLECCLA